MYDEGVAMLRLKLRRREPSISEAELERRLRAWLAREGE